VSDPGRERLPRPVRTPRSLAELAASAGIASAADQSYAAVEVTGLTLDSRDVQPGDVYAALAGEHAHGADFAAQAADRGAVAVLTDPGGAGRARSAGLPVLVAENPRAVLGDLAAAVYGHPAARLLTFGVTGTNGKTTVSYLIEAGLRAAGLVTGLLGTVQTIVAGDAVPSERTTPEAPDVQALLALMVERGCGAAVLEVSSHALVLGRVDSIRFDVATFLNLSQDHLDFHPTFEDYFEAKASLFSPARASRAVVDADDGYGRRLIDRLRTRGDLPLTTFSTGTADADWRADAVRSGPDGSTFDIVGPDGRRMPARINLAGRFNVANAVAAVVSLAVAGVDPEDATRGIAALAGVPGRMERIDAGQPYLALVDFAHTPRAVRALLATVREVTPGRVILVLGCGGERDRAKRPLMGAEAVAGADLAIFTNDNPRGEDPAAILAAIVAGARAADPSADSRITVEPDRAAAIARAVGTARPGDSVVVAGKGHEPGQQIGSETRPFDDREQVRSAIERLAVAS
jgi:UDP-N-acetylmuramoyl-L-alanyl-D-glutamate--2,6-diaminopimelate ligase